MLVKARMAGRIAGCLFIFGAAVLCLWGIFSNYLPTLLDGIVLGVASVLPFVVSKYAEKKLNDIGV